jgi:hypothetical protein
LVDGLSVRAVPGALLAFTFLPPQLHTWKRVAGLSGRDRDDIVVAAAHLGWLRWGYFAWPYPSGDGIALKATNALGHCSLLSEPALSSNTRVD